MWLDRSRSSGDNICAGKGRAGDLELLEDLSELPRKATLCALGQSASSPVQSTLRHFRDEYQAHIEGKRCPAHVCRALSPVAPS